MFNSQLLVTNQETVLFLDDSLVDQFDYGYVTVVPYSKFKDYLPKVV